LPSTQARWAYTTHAPPAKGLQFGCVGKAGLGLQRTGIQQIAGARGAVRTGSAAAISEKHLKGIQRKKRTLLLTALFLGPLAT